MSTIHTKRNATKLQSNSLDVMETEKNKRAGLLLRFFSGLRFPWLFAAFLVIFGIDLVVPDVFPFVDELLLGMMTLLLGAWRKRKDDGAARGDVEGKIVDARDSALPAPRNVGGID
jgi:hypothetical protein